MKASWAAWSSYQKRQEDAGVKDLISLVHFCALYANVWDEIAQQSVSTL